MITPDPYYNGISRKEWLKHVKTHMRLLEDAVRRHDLDSIDGQASCVRSQVSRLCLSFGLPGFSEDIKIKHSDGTFHHGSHADEALTEKLKENVRIYWDAFAAGAKYAREHPDDGMSKPGFAPDMAAE